MAKYYFKEGEEVYHKDNLKVKLIVNRVLKDSVQIRKGFDMKEGKPIMETVIRMIGVECHWWEHSEALNEKQLRTYKFHSTELVPKDIVEKGIEAVKQWLIEFNIKSV